MLTIKSPHLYGRPQALYNARTVLTSLRNRRRLRVQGACPAPRVAHSIKHHSSLFGAIYTGCCAGGGATRAVRVPIPGSGRLQAGGIRASATSLESAHHVPAIRIRAAVTSLQHIQTIVWHVHAISLAQTCAHANMDLCGHTRTSTHARTRTHKHTQTRAHTHSCRGAQSLPPAVRRRAPRAPHPFDCVIAASRICALMK